VASEIVIALSEQNISQAFILKIAFLELRSWRCCFLCK